MKILKVLRNTDRERRLDLAVNESDGWYRLRLIRFDRNEALTKIIGISPEEMKVILEVGTEMERWREVSHG